MPVVYSLKEIIITLPSSSVLNPRLHVRITSGIKKQFFLGCHLQGFWFNCPLVGWRCRYIVCTPKATLTCSQDREPPGGSFHVSSYRFLELPSPGKALFLVPFFFFFTNPNPLFAVEPDRSSFPLSIAPTLVTFTMISGVTSWLWATESGSSSLPWVSMLPSFLPAVSPGHDSNMTP